MLVSMVSTALANPVPMRFVPVTRGRLSQCYLPCATWLALVTLLAGCGGGGGGGGGRGASEFSVGGTLAGLAGGTSAVLEDNGGDALTLTANGAFKFATQLSGGATYAVTVMSQPSAEYCWVTAGSGTVSGANVSNVAVNCTSVPAANPVTLHTFSPDEGSGPTNLVQGNDGNLYGTLYYGVSTPDGGELGCGAFFRMSTTGVETTIYEFKCDTSDVQSPFGNLIQASDGAFYGTSIEGGTNEGGGVFRVTPQGAETLLFGDFVGAHAFGPTGVVQGANGNFYGTTYGGGVSDDGGTVFTITPSGVETVIDTFQGGDSYVFPSPLIQASDGNFYGVTGGGAYNAGMVYSVTPAGVRTLVHSFGGSGDGAFPPPLQASYSPLIQATDGNLYGTTLEGGSTGGAGQGTIYRVTLAGDETVIYSFGSDAALPGTDGIGPSVLIQGSDGNLYGTTQGGGATNQGVIFEVTLDGHEVWRYSFQLGPSGVGPPLLVQGIDGKFYGINSTGAGFFFTF
jgi:uncharacterized repeat protein (TIGR03803 family)